jgi:hypothetical protein
VIGALIASGRPASREPRRRSRMLLRLIGAMLAAAVLAGDPIHATGQPTTGSASPTDEARRLFLEGVAAAKADQWEEARDRFERSYRASPAALTLFNLAGAQRNTKRLVAAGESYRTFLRQTDGGRYEAFRRAAEQELAELERLTPVVRIRAPGALPSDEVSIDGDPVPFERAGEGILLDPGSHVATVRRAGRIAARREFEVAPKQRITVELRVPLPTAPPVAPAEQAILTTSQSSSPPTTERSLWRSPWFWAITSVLVTGAGAAGYLVYDRNRGSSQEPTAGTLGTFEVP